MDMMNIIDFLSVAPFIIDTRDPWTYRAKLLVRFIKKLIGQDSPWIPDWLHYKTNNNRDVWRFYSITSFLTAIKNAKAKFWVVLDYRKW